MKIILAGIGIVLACVGAALLAALIRTLRIPVKQAGYRPEPGEEESLALARKLSAMIQCETVSCAGTTDVLKFRKFHEVLAELFPLVFEKLEKTDIDGNLLFTWKGRKHDKPLVLMSHQDVVPAEGKWLHEPFSGDIADGKVWGRGASDTKCSVMGFFEAVEELLKEGYEPEEDVYLSSSCTEEWAGDGCPKIVAELQRRGVRPYLVVDEGGGIITDPIAGIPGNFAMVGVFEKGKADLRFTAKGNGGHASAPPANSPIVRLAAFVTEVEKGKMFRKAMPPQVQAMFETLAPYASFGLRYVFENMWLFKPLLVRLLPKISAQAGAMLRTTAAFTQASGSKAVNVLPEEASVSVNMRFIPHQGMKESLELMEKTAKKYDLTMEILHANDYSKSADIHGPAFGMVSDVIQKTFPGVASSPYCMTGATDARVYEEICDNVVRFAPVIYGPEQMRGMHGLNENIAYNCLPGCVQFYRNLIMENDRRSLTCGQ